MLTSVAPLGRMAVAPERIEVELSHFSKIGEESVSPHLDAQIDMAAALGVLIAGEEDGI